MDIKPEKTEVTATTSAIEPAMREQFARTVENMMARDERVALLLAEISVSLFKRALRDFPERVVNVGIMEQTLVSAAAGFALEGFIPVLHSIAPFLVERPFEQIKDDFCYQNLPGNFVSNGASYDYSEEGMTHHGFADVPVLRSLPGMRIVVPGAPAELDTLFRAVYGDGGRTYFRTSVKRNREERPVRFGALDVVREGSRAAVVAVGPMLDATLAAAGDLDVSVLYCTTVAPFDGETLRAHATAGKVALVEPYEAGALVPDVVAALAPRPARVEAIGVPRAVLSRYGTPEQHDEALGLTPSGIRARITRLLDE